METESGLPKYVTRDSALHLLERLGNDFVIIENPSYVHPHFDICPLAPRRKHLDRGARAFLVDMDGTTTTTEELCLNALEHFVRKATGWDRKEWTGLDPVRDFPYIIGTSTSQNIAYLAKVHGHAIQPRLLLAAFLESVAWTLGKSQSAARKAEVEAHMAVLGMQPVLDDPRFALLRFTAFSGTHETQSALNLLVDKYVQRFPLQSETDRVRAGTEIYYQRLHSFFLYIGAGKGAAVSKEVHGDESVHPIRPLPGLGMLHAIAKGWLGTDAGRCVGLLQAHMPEHVKPAKGEAERLSRLGAYFERNPAAVALVTSSARYEANVVLKSNSGTCPPGARDR
mgnify:CR=1 FL=1